MFKLSDLWFPFFDGEDQAGGAKKEDENAKTPDQTDDKGNPTDKTFTQDEVDRIVRTRLTREKDSIRTQVLADLQKKKDEDDAIKRGEFDKLLAEKDEEIRKLGGLQTVIEEFEELARERYDATLKTLPEPIQALAPEETASALERERWLTKKAMPALAKWEKEFGKTTKRGPNDGTQPDPQKEDRQKRVQDLLKQAQSAGQYNF